VKARLDAKNSLESFAYTIKQTAEEAKDKLDVADKDILLAKVDETILWLDANQQADKEEFEAKQAELQSVSSPIMTKLHQGNAGSGPAPAATGAEEVD